MAPSIRKLYDKILYEQHLERVKNMLPTIDNSTPRRLPLINHRRLDDRKMKDRIIQKENYQILLNLAKVIQKSSIDNKLSNHVKETQTFKQHLLRIKRKNELKKITDENLQLLKRIQDVPPTIHFYTAAPAIAPASAVAPAPAQILTSQKLKLPKIGDGKN